MNENEGYTIGGGGRALMLLHGLGQSPGALRPLAEELAGEGLTACVPALFEKGAHWSEWLRAARSAYTGLMETHPRVSLCALGESGALALLLAEEYAPERLLLVPDGRQRADAAAWSGLRALDRRARQGLFSLDIRPRILLPEGANIQALRRARRLSRRLGGCPIGEYRKGALFAALRAAGN